jgi:hypothetical protein
MRRDGHGDGERNEWMPITVHMWYTSSNARVAMICVTRPRDRKQVAERDETLDVRTTAGRTAAVASVVWVHGECIIQDVGKQ